MATKQNFRAQAKLVPLSYLHRGEYVTGSETSASYLKITNELELVRINCIAAVVRREDLGSITILTIDDGTDNITVRIFDGRAGIDTISVGQVVLVVGRIREYNAERYIAAEIIRSVSPRWLRYRSLLLHHNILLESNILEKKKVVEIEETKEKPKTVQKQKINTVSYSTGEINKTNKESNLSVTAVVEEKKEISVSASSSLDTLESPVDVNPYIELMSLIAKLDSGDGVPLEVVIYESVFQNTEELLQKMMETGDIFQNMPGKVKVL